MLFDLDGTLADTVELILACYRHTMTTHLGQAPPDAAWLSGMGTPLREQLRAFARSEPEAAAMADTYSVHQRAFHDDMVRLYPGVAESLEALASNGVPLGVVTSRRREMALRTLRCCGVLERFPVVVSPDEVSRAKPDPEPVLLALELLGVEADSRALLVGDSPYDIRAGRAAGTTTAAALWGPFPRAALEAAAPHHWLEEPRDLIGLSALR